jgi:hypothetical protein
MPGASWREPFFTWFVRGLVGFFGLVRNPRGRRCAVCGTRRKRGVWVCPECGYDYWPSAFSPPLPHPQARSPEDLPPGPPPPSG